MRHNEISFLYREVLKALGIDFDSLLSADRSFWDRRIHTFASTYNRTTTERKLKFLLLLDLLVIFAPKGRV